MKKCYSCLETKDLTCFYKHKGMKDGHLNLCKACHYAKVKENRKANPNSRKEEWARHRIKNGLKTREEYFQYRKENAVGQKIRSKRYSHKRRLQTNNYVFTEFDEFVQTEAYILIGLREKSTNIKWNLDHIIPLNYKEACGLHTAFNFQVVPASWNFKKGNRNMDTWIAGV